MGESEKVVRRPLRENRLLSDDNNNATATATATAIAIAIASATVAAMN